MPLSFLLQKHEMMSCFEGLLWYYRVTGEKKYLDAENFARNEKSDITVLGSAGCTNFSILVNQFNLALPVSCGNLCYSYMDKIVSTAFSGYRKKRVFGLY